MLLISTANVGFGQANIYHPFPDSNAVWRVIRQSGQACPYPQQNATYSSYQYTINGDTTIGLYNYKKIYSSGLMGICLYTTAQYFYKYAGSLRQDTTSKKVYFRYPASNEALLYDFSLVVGDTVTTINTGTTTAYVTISSIDSAWVGNGYRKRFETNPYNGAFVEGIGSMSGLLEADDTYVAFEDSYTLICFADNKGSYLNSASCALVTNPAGIQKIDMETDIRIYPNPAKDNIEVKLNNTIPETKLSIIDINGKVVLTKYIDKSVIIDVGYLSNGIYNISINNGMMSTNKKMVIVR